MKLELLPEALQKCYDKGVLVYKDDDEFYYNIGCNVDFLTDVRNHDFQIYNGTYRHNYETHTTDILLIGRGRTCGKKWFTVQGYYPNCYVDSTEGDHKTYLGVPVEKLIFFMEPKAVANYRKKCEILGKPIPYEADIKFVQRFLIDTFDFFKPTTYVEPHIAIFDVETNFPVNNNLISFALNGYDGQLYYNSAIIEGNEWGLALDLYIRLLDYDLVTNWNVEFDISALDDKLETFRMFLKPLQDGYHLLVDDYIRVVHDEYLTISIDSLRKIYDILRSYNLIQLDEADGYLMYGTIPLYDDLTFHITPVELLPITKKMYGREIPGRWTLDNVGRRLCGIEKVDIGDKNPRDLTQEQLFEYNIRDVIIPEIIDETFGGIRCHVILAWSVHSIINDTIVTAEVNDIALIRQYHKRKQVLNSRSSKFVTEEKEEPGYAAAEPDARPGVYDNLVSSDLHAAYPSAVIAINASPETKDPNGCHIAPNGVRFNNNPSIFIDTLKELLHDREDVKKQLKTLDKHTQEYKTLKSIDFAIKTQVAALSHGVFGWESSRMKDMEVADAITAVVREILDLIKESVDKMGYQWVYVHTDSCYFIAPREEAQKIIDSLNEIIKEFCTNKGYSIIPRLDYKGYYQKAYIHSPARNVLVDENGEWITTGMNYDRSEVPEPLAEIEKMLISAKLDRKDNDAMIGFLRELIKNLKEMDSKDLGVIKPLTKPVSKYGKMKDGVRINLPYHVKALLLAGDTYGFKIKVGEKYMILPIISNEFTGVKKKKRKVVFMAYPIEEGLPNNFKIDFETYLRSNLWGKVNNLFNLKPKELEKAVMTEEMRSFMYTV